MTSSVASNLRVVLVDPTDRYLKSVRASAPMLIRTTACLQPPSSSSSSSSYPLGLITTRSVPLFLTLLALPTVTFSAVMAKRKVTAEELPVWAESSIPPVPASL
jgi:hypothetical protein